ncbi:MAG: peptidoglycan-binding protein [Oscillospiraceae bacterium]|nr:peptidoglycan-binding protein [Oscillospiraceae bacterium]
MNKTTTTDINRLKAFTSYLEDQVKNHSIYVWGGQGEDASIICEDWIKRRENSKENANRAIRFWQAQCAAGYKDKLRAFDCSGLGVYYFLKNGFISTDTTADGLLRMSAPIQRIDVRIGDIVCKVNSKGKATHIGYVADNNLNVIEAKGRDAGVVKSHIDTGSWNAYGRLPFWTATEVAEAQGKYIFTRVLKLGCHGDDVKALKKLLAKKGYTGLTTTNGNFLLKTQSVVKRFQKDRGLTVDGKAGRVTITEVGGVWRG